MKLKCILYVEGIESAMNRGLSREDAECSDGGDAVTYVPKFFYCQKHAVDKIKRNEKIKARIEEIEAEIEKNKARIKELDELDEKERVKKASKRWFK